MEEEAVEKEVYAETRIPLILQSYNDIFSSFDPRSYSEKAISVDFIEEAQRASMYKNGDRIELTLAIPKKIRNLNDESKIKKRIIIKFNISLN